MTAAAEYEITDLLEQAGAQPPRCGRGKWICPDCKRPTLSVNVERGVYHCFHAGCGFQGGPGGLRKRLGLHWEWLPHNEYVRKQQQREQAERAAAELYARVNNRRFQLYEALESLARIERGAHAKPEHAQVWEALEVVYRERPAIIAELAFLENAHALSVVRFLEATQAERQAVIDTITAHGGFFIRRAESASTDSFVEVLCVNGFQFIRRRNGGRP